MAVKLKRSAPFQDSNGRWRLPNGRFMKLGESFDFTAKDTARPGDGATPPVGGRTRGPRLATAGAKLSERQLERIDERFSTAFDTPGGRTAAKGRKSVTDSLFPEDSGRNPLARRTPIEPMAGVDFPAPPAAKAPRRRKMSDKVREAAYGRGVTDALFGSQGGVGGLRRDSAAHPPTPDGTRAAYADVLEALDGFRTGEEAEAYLRNLKLTRAQLADIVTAQGKKPGSSTKDHLIGLAARGARMRGYRNAVATTFARPAEAASEQRVRDAHASLVTRVGDWVSIADLRDRLGGMPREEQDAALERLARSPGVTIIPWDNRNALEARDHAAALRFGGEDNHAIRIEGVAPGSRTFQTDAGERITREEAGRRMFGDRGSLGGAASRIASAGRSQAVGSRAVQALRSAASREEGHQILSGLTVAELRETAAAADIAVPARRTRKQLRADIVAVLVGRRIDSFVINPDRGPAARAASRSTPQTDTEVEQSVYAAYRRLAASPGDLVSLVRLRHELGDIDRETLDRILKKLDRARTLQLEPDPNRKAFTREIRDAAVKLGGEDKHFIYIG